jgi:hypothetical protein
VIPNPPAETTPNRGALRKTRPYLTYTIPPQSYSLNASTW